MWFDRRGLVIKTSEPGGLVTKSAYDGAGHMLTLKAHLAGGGYQKTEWAYVVSSATGSDFASNDILRAVKYPDKTTGDPSSSEQARLHVGRKRRPQCTRPADHVLDR